MNTVREDITNILTDRQLAIVKARLNGHSWRTIAAANQLHESTCRGHWKAAIQRINRSRKDPT